MDQRPDQRVVLQQAIQHVAGLARGTGDGLRGEHPELVGQVGVEGDRPVVVAEVARGYTAPSRPSRCTAKRWPSDEDSVPSPQVR